MLARRTKQASFWPDAMQTLLLHAVLDEPESAKRAAHAWLGRVAFDDLDAGSQRLMPLFSLRLRGFGISHPLRPRIDGLYRRAWYMDQRMRAQLRSFRALLDDAEVPHILLKGAALGTDAYAHGSLRPADDIDVLVPRERFDAVARLLKGIGMRSLMPRLELFGHAESFSSELGRIDVHISPFSEAAQADAVAPLWREKRRLAVDGKPASVLSLHDQLLHTLVHGLRRNVVPPVRWVADACNLLARHGGHIDWERFASRTTALRYDLVAYKGLEYLAREFQAPVPRRVLERLARGRRDLNQLAEFHFGRRGRLFPLALWAVTARVEPHAGRRLGAMMDYYAQAWGVDTRRQLFLRAGCRLFLGRRATAALFGARRKG